MAYKRISVITESDSGRNSRFKDNKTGQQMSRRQLVSKISQGSYAGYHIRKINNLATPVSDPDNRKGNNLG